KIDPSDGKLNIVAFNPRSLWNLLSRKPKVQTFTGRSITIKPRKSKHFEVDGDVYRGKTVQVEIIPKAIQIVRT
ncbi:MAG: hypothetical protein Q8P27_03560, partial [Candidatus Peregrinibacteria bacterium]|nr:hypothetical protein [Candidatus Peregrinibacteria bacterium]